MLGQFPSAPAELLLSDEADIYPKNHPERWELIDGSIGELSTFHDTFGYYAQGVQEGVAVLPKGWRERLVAVRNEATRGATGWCLEIHDLVISKYAANREKDRRFNRAAAKHGLVREEELQRRLNATDMDDAVKDHVKQLIASDFRSLK